MRLDLMHIVADRIENRSDGLRREFRTLALSQHELGAVEIETGGPALVHLDMRFLVAHHAAVRRHHRCQREAVCRGARGDPQHGAGPLEHLRETVVQSGAQCIAIIRRIGGICGLESIPHGRVDRGGIIGEKLHRNAIAMCALVAQKGNFRQ